MPKKHCSERAAGGDTPLGITAPRWMIAMTCCVSVSSPANAYYAIGLGRLSCQEYLDASRELEPGHFMTLYKGARKYFSMNNDFDQWLFGAVTATNYASHESGRHPDIQPTATELVTWMRAWCHTHPDDFLTTAVIAFLREKWNAADTPLTPPALAAAPPASQAVAPQGVNSLPAALQSLPQFVFVIFQKDVGATDMAAFFKTYHVAIDDGPNQDGFYKLRLAAPLPSDQLAAMLESMRSQSKIVNTAVTN